MRLFLEVFCFAGFKSSRNSSVFCLKENPSLLRREVPEQLTSAAFTHFFKILIDRLTNRSIFVYLSILFRLNRHSCHLMLFFTISCPITTSILSATKFRKKPLSAFCQKICQLSHSGISGLPSVAFVLQPVSEKLESAIMRQFSAEFLPVITV